MALNYETHLYNAQGGMH